MAVGPGRYDDECTAARALTAAQVCMLIVIGGAKGSGFSVQVAGTDEQNAAVVAKLPALLREMARQIEGS